MKQENLNGWKNDTVIGSIDGIGKATTLTLLTLGSPGDHSWSQNEEIRGRLSS